MRKRFADTQNCEIRNWRGERSLGEKSECFEIRWPVHLRELRRGDDGRLPDAARCEKRGKKEEGELLKDTCVKKGTMAARASTELQHIDQRSVGYDGLNV